MSDDKKQNSKTVILAADMVDFSRKLEMDAEGTRRAFQSNLGKILKPAVAFRNGRNVTVTDRGVLAEFSSVLEAIRCAVDIQKVLAKHNSGSSTARNPMYRIGINTGADGAAGLESLAEPGGICLSEPAYDQVKTLRDVVFTDLGEQSVTNNPNPIHAYHIQLGANAGSRADTGNKPELAIGDRLANRAAIASLVLLTVAALSTAAYYFQQMKE